MLQFGGFPIANATVSEETGSPIQPSADLRHTCAYPQLIAACHDLHRHSSRAIPQLGCSSTCMLPHHASNPSVSSHANSASTENHLLEGDSPQPFPRHDRHDRVLSNHPTFPPYKKKSVQDEPATAEQSCVLAVFQRLRKFTSFWGKVAPNSPSQPNLRSPCRAFQLPGSTDRD